MAELLANVIPLLLVDVLNPVLFAVLIFVAGSDRPIANSVAMIMGHTVAYFLVGIAAAYAVDIIADRLANPKPVDYLVKLLVGLACLYAALASRGGAASEERNPAGELTVWHCFSYGAVINFLGAPFALPYLAVVSAILDADISLAQSWAVLVGYNLAYAAPFTLVPGLLHVMGERAKPVLHKINNAMVRGADLLLPWIMFALGLYLLGDCLLWLLNR